LPVSKKDRKRSRKSKPLFLSSDIIDMQMCDQTTSPDGEEVIRTFWAHFAPCRGGLYAYIRKSLNYSEDSDDIFQETVLRAYKYFTGFQADRSFRTWIYAIAHNELKKQYKRKSEAVDHLPEELCSGKDGSTDPLMREEVRRLHLLAMDLKPAWREVFFLYYQDGFSVDEVAAVTGRSGGYVKFILHRCRKAVRARLGDLS